MRYDDFRRSDNIDDRRDDDGGGGMGRRQINPTAGPLPQKPAHRATRWAT